MRTFCIMSFPVRLDKQKSFRVQVISPLCWDMPGTHGRSSWSIFRSCCRADWVWRLEGRDKSTQTYAKHRASIYHPLYWKKKLLPNPFWELFPYWNTFASLSKESPTLRITTTTRGAMPVCLTCLKCWSTSQRSGSWSLGSWLCHQIHRCLDHRWSEIDGIKCFLHWHAQTFFEGSLPEYA